ncbi:MAG: hypothetical protein ABSF29_14770 [Tepidisphaeraceae bacterium]
MSADSVFLAVDGNASPRVVYGAGRLAQAISAAGMQIENSAGADSIRILIGKPSSDSIQKMIRNGEIVLGAGEPKAEGFLLQGFPDGLIAVVGADDSGELYGCLELASRIRDAGRLPENLHFMDAPAFKLRGPCIGMQKSFILPGRHVYEYPYTPELFPFFYDKGFWQQYLDFLADNRMNTLYIWAGHPFASLVKLPDYPYAVEVPPDVFAKNVEMFHYIVTEADKRGIWVVQMFYNILVSKPFADHNGISTQLSAPTPLVADYTRKSIAAFVREYPNVGLMFCLGEALRGIDNQVQWCTQVILPGVKDGMAEAHLTAEPPVIIRTHATDASVVVPEALKVYHNLYTEEKFNGESLTTWEPRGTRQALHLEMSRLGSTHIVNVHILANLEPFRYGDQEFIRKCMLAARDRLGAKGLHLYPLSYWNWPDSPDDTNPPLKQWKRDWIWFEAWARYAWNPDVDEATDHAYWVHRISQQYGSDVAAEDILAAYDDSGECAPRLLRRFGITEGNRQTLSLGMTLDELVDPGEYDAFAELWESQSPPGERIQEYVDREWEHQPHVGETPPQIIREVLEFSSKAQKEIDSAGPLVTRNRDEYLRLQNDIRCIGAMSRFYCDKVGAAMCVLRYRHSHDLGDLDQAVKFLTASVADYEELMKFGSWYRFANSMQTSQRQIPVPGGVHGEPANFRWDQVVGVYVKERDNFIARVAAAHQGLAASDDSGIVALPRAPFTLLTADAKTYDVKVGAKVFGDRDYAIQSLAPELNGLQGILVLHGKAKKGKYVPVEFETTEAVRVLVGYFKSSDREWLQPVDAETDAAAAERGEATPVIRNAVSILSLPPVDVYVQNYDAGRHQLTVPGAGSFIILGVIPQSAVLNPRDAHRSSAF